MLRCDLEKSTKRTLSPCICCIFSQHLIDDPFVERGTSLSVTFQIAETVAIAQDSNRSVSFALSPNRSRNDNSNWSRNITFLVDCRLGGRSARDPAESGALTGVAIRDSFIHEHFSMDRPYMNDSFHVLKAGTW